MPIGDLYDYPLGGGGTCSVCGKWVGYGAYHTCYTVNPPPVPPIQYTPSVRVDEGGYVFLSKESVEQIAQRVVKLFNGGKREESGYDVENGVLKFNYPSGATARTFNAGCEPEPCIQWPEATENCGY